MVAAAHELLREKGAGLHQATVERIFEFGLHEFLVDFISGTRQIAFARVTASGPSPIVAEIYGPEAEGRREAAVWSGTKLKGKDVREVNAARRMPMIGMSEHSSQTSGAVR